jgi:hypothetical protein
MVRLSNDRGRLARGAQPGAPSRQGRPTASGRGPKALHKYDTLAVPLRHQSRVSALAEVKTGYFRTVILLGSRKACKETEVQDNEIE